MTVNYNSKIPIALNLLKLYNNCLPCKPNLNAF